MIGEEMRVCPKCGEGLVLVRADAIGEERYVCGFNHVYPTSLRTHDVSVTMTPEELDTVIGLLNTDGRYELAEKLGRYLV